MVLRELQLENFRLFSQIEITFSSDINIITGKNGQGKTSILESLYYAALTKSFKTNNDRNVVCYDKDHFNIVSSFSADDKAPFNLRVFYSLADGKHLFLDGRKILRFSEYIGTVPCVLLTLDDLKLTLGSPGERRRFLDILLSQVSPLYLDHLKNYRRSLMQRNALLSRNTDVNIQQELETWNAKLVEHGTAIIVKRKELIDYLNNDLSEQYNRFVNKKEKISVEYRCFTDPSSEDLTGQFYERLQRSYHIDRQRNTTTTGPHRDDLEFYKNGKSFKEYGSQGENKTLVIAIKLSEWEYLSSSRNTKPILLLDDIFGELDQYRIQALVNVLHRVGQGFITTTMEMFPFKGNKLIVSEGKVFDG
jgi:DNA replication and repair protein RecF